METALEEISFSFSGASDSEKQHEIGKLLSVQYVIVGSLGKIGSNFLLNLKMIEVETGETISTVSERYESMDILLDDSKSNIFELVGIAQENKSKGSIKGSSVELGISFDSFTNEYYPESNPTSFGGVLGYTYSFSRLLALGGLIKIFRAPMDYITATTGLIWVRFIHESKIHLG